MRSRSRSGCCAEAAAEVVGRIRRNILIVCATFSCIFGEAHTLRSAMQSDVQLIEKKGQCSQARESAGTYRNGRTAASGSAYPDRLKGKRRTGPDIGYEISKTDIGVHRIAGPVYTIRTLEAAF
jgi:hypothetical protein